ncbi:hypothetical protein [Euzebyella saccharophila]|uniref:Uncharacterized protein n=1 Tax=Euzebyella saccharophila TaxID=679664 RepID=A0ABV8JLN3_9FLAO|nr:hypothetical protein [Euzebyella saccharophila]
MLRTFLEYTYLAMYAIALVAAIYRYPKYFDTKLQYLPIIICYTLFNEILGYLTAYLPQFGFFSRESISHYNVIIYNIYNLIFYLYFLFLFRFYIKSPRLKEYIFWGIVLFLVTSAINPFFQNYLMSTQTATYISGGFLLITSIIFYLREQHFKYKRIPLANHPLHWISIGLLLFYVGYLPIKVGRYFHFANGTQEAPIIRIIQYLLIITMYAFITMGFITLKKRSYR